MQSLVIFLPTIDPAVNANGEIIKDSVDSLLWFVLWVNILLNIPIDPISSYGMYRIAYWRGIMRPWLAWIPIANLWILGNIADQCYRETHDRQGKMRWFMLTYQIIIVLLFLAWRGFTPVAVLLGWMAKYALLFLVVLIITCIVATFIALHRLFASYHKNICGIFTALCVLFSIPTPFLILHCAQKE